MGITRRGGKKDAALVHLVALAEFDEDRGTTLRQRFPKDSSIGDLSEDQMAELGIPEGAHLHKEDTPYMILTINGETMYGMAYFKTVADESLKRKARQAACMVVARRPYFDTFQPFLADALSIFLDKERKEKDLLKTLYKTLNEVESKTTVCMWNKEYHLTVKAFKEDEFGNVSLTKLVMQFKEETMILCPLFTQKSYIIGTCSSIIETMQDKHDCVGSFSGAISVTHVNQYKVQGRDKHFIKSIISGIDDKKGEKWLRTQFERHTAEFLRRCEANELKDMQKKLLGPASERPFDKTEMWMQYCKTRAETPETGIEPVKSPKELLELIRSSETTRERVMPLKQLDDALENIDNTEVAVDHGGVDILTTSLFATDSTERKYAVNILASMARLIKGQVAILHENTLERILDLMFDKRPNVQNAASRCLLRISSLYIGAKALVDRGAVQHLVDIVCAEDFDNLTLKSNAANTLLQMYRMLDIEPPADVSRFRLQLKSSDMPYTSLILLLLDKWRVSVANAVPIPLSITTRLKALRAREVTEDGEMVTDKNSRTLTTSSLQAELIRSPIMALQLVEANALPDLWENLSLPGAEDDMLGWASWDVITLIADSHAGACAILELRIIDQALQKSLEKSGADWVFRVLRFFEVCCQHVDLGRRFMENDGVQRLVSFIYKHYSEDIRMLCVPALSALRYLIRFQCDAKRYEEIRYFVAPLTALPLLPEAQQGQFDSRTTELDKLLRVVLYMARVSKDLDVQEDIMLGEYYQTIGRRSKALTSTYDFARRDRNSSNASSTGALSNAGPSTVMPSMMETVAE